MVAIPGFAQFTAADFDANLRAIQAEATRRQQAQSQALQGLSRALAIAGHDISQNKRAMNALRLDAAKSGIVLNAGPAGQIQAEPSERVRLENEAAVRALKASKEADDRLSALDRADAYTPEMPPVSPAARAIMNTRRGNELEIKRKEAEIKRIEAAQALAEQQKRLLDLQLNAIGVPIPPPPAVGPTGEPNVTTPLRPAFPSDKVPESQQGGRDMLETLPSSVPEDQREIRGQVTLTPKFREEHDVNAERERQLARDFLSQVLASAQTRSPIPYTDAEFERFVGDQIAVDINREQNLRATKPGARAEARAQAFMELKGSKESVDAILENATSMATRNDRYPDSGFEDDITDLLTVDRFTFFDQATQRAADELVSQTKGTLNEQEASRVVGKQVEIEAKAFIRNNFDVKLVDGQVTLSFNKKGQRLLSRIIQIGIETGKTREEIQSSIEAIATPDRVLAVLNRLGIDVGILAR